MVNVRQAWAWVTALVIWMWAGASSNNPQYPSCKVEIIMLAMQSHEEN